MASKDFLDELIEEGADRDAQFPAMVDEAYERRRQLRKHAKEHQQPGIIGESETLQENGRRDTSIGRDSGNH